MKLIPHNFMPEIQLRMQALRENMHKAQTDALLIAYNTNIFYTTGCFFRGYVYVSLDKDPLWFIIKPDSFDKETFAEVIRKPENIPSVLAERGYRMPEKIGIEFDDLSYSTVLRLKALFTDSEAVNGSTILKYTRMVKTPWEILQMKEDGRHHVKVYSKIKSCYRKGMTDLQFQIEIEKELRLEGALGVSRVSGNLMDINLGSVISGENADTPSPYEFTMGGAGVNPSHPVGADSTPIKDGTTVMIDMNGVFNGYQTDMTRVWRAGEITGQAKKAHSCSIKILRALEKMALPGTPVSSLYDKAMEIVDAEGLREYFMGHKSQVGFIGHGVGIELNELPVVNSRSKDILRENVTIALEPKFVIPHIGAVGVENTYRVTPEGLENLTVFPEEIEEL